MIQTELQNGFNNVKSLNEITDDIMKSKASKTAKREALIKVGIRENEVNLVMKIWAAENGIVTTPRVRRPSLAIQFGVELECFVEYNGIQAPRGLVFETQTYNHRNTNGKVFKLVPDGSVSGLSNPIECVSPVMKGQRGLNDVKRVCETLQERGARVNKTCGYHVHINASDLTDEQYANVFANYAYCEAVIDKFMPQSRRANSAYYCKSIVGKVENCRTREEVQRAFVGNVSHPESHWRGGARYYKVNAMSWFGHKTVEFRHHGGTTNATKVTNWVKFCGKLVEWSKKHRLTSPITSIDEMTWLDDELKTYYKARTSELNA